MTQLRVLLAGGGTSGHIEPALNLGDAIRAAHPDAHVVALGTTAGLDTRVIPARGYELELIPKVVLPRHASLTALATPAQLLQTVRAARRVIERHRITVVVGFGGYVSAPAYIAARQAKVPIVVHEANALAGVSNRLGARLTRYVAVTAAGTSLRGARQIGLPLRPEIAHLDRVAARASAARSFGLDPGLATLLVTGGSQGARSINGSAIGAAQSLAAVGQVLHVAGPGNVDEVAASVPAGLEQRYKVVGFVDGMAGAYAASDLVLCRCGAMTCAELTAVGLPAVFVPLPIGNGEQRLNAEPAVAAGGGLLVEDAELDASWIERTVVPLLSDKARLDAMSAALVGVQRPDAAAALVALVEEAAAGGIR